jgi:hypothetical protein
MTRLIRLLAFVLSMATISLVGAVGTGTATAAPPNSGSLQQAVTGTVNGAPFTGTYTITSFKKGDSATGIVAVGQLTGNGIPAGAPAVNVPVQAINGTCQILDLTLGPLDLDLLGLQVHLDQVHLNITAQQGPGNLLGNLLCALAGLLDNTNANVNAIVNLLNQILGALSGAVG